MTDSRIESLLSALGYDDNVKYYHLLKDFSSIPSLSHLSRIFNRINENKNVEIFGAYCIETNADEQQSANLQPIVFVARAEILSEARKLHKALWNSSSVPFVIILLPDEIKIYTGFDYDKDNENRGLIESIEYNQIGLFTELSQLAISALKKYSAESVNNGSIWQRLQNSPNFNYDNRVDKRLLRNLEELEQELLGKLKDSINETEALKHIHSIIGKYVYFRYLKDRKILTPEWVESENINVENVFQRGATLSELKRLSDAVENRFEGKIFPFPKGFENVFNDNLVSDVASRFFGDSSLQPVLFSVYDFSYIPVETLSYIYEQFLKSQGLTKKDGAVYTPESLADYLINEISSVKPLQRSMKILDPCCGSGIFLVLTYRYLVELELKKRNLNNLSPDELKQIMEESIYGVELNPEACQVTEFSLILILLNYIEPPDLAQNKGFKFPNLHDKNIFEGDFFDPNKEFYPLTINFDWIIGNPPWKALNVNKNPQDKNALKWVKDNKNLFPVGGNRIEEAFSWRATEFVSINGFIGFVLPAKRLFNSTSKNFREEFFKQNEVRRITNFSNFHYLLFQADVSAITIIYQKADLSKEKKSIWHYSPFVANQKVSLLKKGKPTRPVWTIIINKSEISQIDAEEAEKGEALTWKLAFWGSYEDERAFTRLRNSYSENLHSIVKTKGWNFHEGVRLRSENEENKQVVALDRNLFEKVDEDLKYFDAKRFGTTKFRFHIPLSVLKEIPEGKRFISKKAIPGLSLTNAPHLVLNPKYAVFSDSDFLVKNSYAISSLQKYELWLKSLAVYFSSSLCQYLLFFLSPQWGIERTKLDMNDWENLPIPSFSKDQLQSLSHLQINLAKKEKNGETPEILQKELDLKLEEILEIPTSIRLLIHDFFNVKLTLNKGKVINVKAVKNVQKTELEKYALRLRNELDEFAESGDEKHAVSIIYSKDLTVCQISIYKTNQTQEIRVEKANGKNKVEFENIKNDIQEKFSQWIYIQREVTYFDTNSENFYICKSSRLIDWVESKAISDANKFIGEVLANSKPNFKDISQSQVYGENISKQL